MNVKQIMPFPPTGEAGERDFRRLKPTSRPRSLDDEIIIGLALVEDDADGSTGIEYITMRPSDRKLTVTHSGSGYGYYCY